MRASKSPWLGAAAIFAGILFGLAAFVSPIRFWRLMFALGLLQEWPRSSAMVELVRSGAPIWFASLLLPWIGYRLYRVAIGHPGAKALLLALIFFLGSTAFLLVATLTTFVTLSWTPPHQVQPPLSEILLLAPPFLSLTAIVLLTLGVTRSRVLPLWIPWLGVVAGMAWLADYALKAQMILAAASSPSALHIASGAASTNGGWVASISVGLNALFWVALGVALLRHDGTQQTPTVAVDVPG